ncbi:MAG: PIN domain-containing protein [Elusimicrobiota bacterium]|jgi:predicted nucleic acid-binding protein|nr:PIN domain-containing protein [Elusimicrobiota bacterium]
MRIYLDTCCYCRPFDNQDFDEIYLETRSILMIIDKCEIFKSWLLYSSDVLDDEIDAMAQYVKKQQILSIYAPARFHIDINKFIIARARELILLNVSPFDALHIASAEYEQVDIFLTTDKKLLNQAKRINFKVKVSNPLVWLMEAFNEK